MKFNRHFSWDRRKCHIIPRRLPKWLALLIAVIFISGSVLFGVRARLRRRTANYETRSDTDTAEADGPGELGYAVPFSWFGEKKSAARATFEKENFNLMASDVISLQRRLPEHRSIK